MHNSQRGQGPQPSGYSNSSKRTHVFARRIMHYGLSSETEITRVLLTCSAAHPVFNIRPKSSPARSESTARRGNYLLPNHHTWRVPLSPNFQNQKGRTYLLGVPSFSFLCPLVIKEPMILVSFVLPNRALYQALRPPSTLSDRTITPTT